MKLEGKWISFNEAGEKIVTAYYKEGKKVGKWIYVIEGKLKEVDYSKLEQRLDKWQPQWIQEKYFKDK